MGGGVYSSTARSVRAKSAGYETKSADEIFKSRQINNAMNPHGIVVRESKDICRAPAGMISAELRQV